MSSRKKLLSVLDSLLTSPFVSSWKRAVYPNDAFPAEYLLSTGSADAIEHQARKTPLNLEPAPSPKQLASSLLPSMQYFIRVPHPGIILIYAGAQVEDLAQAYNIVSFRC